MGAHRDAMHDDADLSLPRMAGLVAEFLDRLDLHDVTLVGNDTGGALVQLLACDDSPRIGRIVLASCEAFDNFPARVTGTTLAQTGKLPPVLFGLFMQQMRLRPVRRLPIAFGWLTKRGDATTARWMKPVLQQREIRRDAVRMLRAIAGQPNLLVDTARDLPSSSDQLWWYGPARTGSCRSSMGVGSASSCRTRVWSRSPTATPFCRWTSPSSSQGRSGTSRLNQP